MEEEITLPVEGMTCSGCENNIQFAVSVLPGVEAVKADHKAKTVKLRLDPSVADERSIRRAIEDMGYTVPD